MGTLVVGLAFGGIFLWAFKRMRNDMKNNTCACSGGCTDKSKCCKSETIVHFK